MIKREQRTDNTMLFNLDYDQQKELSILSLTDVHYDSPICDRKLLKKHLDMCVAREGSIFFNGDLFDVMGCYKDPRTKAEDIRPEYIGKNYLDLVIEDTYEFLKPYADRILFMGYGNHETAILKHRDTDPIHRIISMLNMNGNNILKSKYYGAARFNFSRKGGGSKDFYLVHHHGYGGNAKRSKGVLNVDINSQRFTFADVYFSGHIHQKWQVSNTQECINKNDELKSKIQYHVCGGCYQGLEKPINMGWPVEKGMNPSVTGGWFINLEAHRKNKNKIINIDVNIEDAK